MKRLAGALVACTLVVAAAPALADKANDAREAVKAARREGGYTFCSKPHKPFLPRQTELCPMEKEVDDCEGFDRACADRFAKEEPPRTGLFEALAKVLGPLAQVLAWALVGLILVLVAIPVIRALVRAQRDRQLKDAPAKANVASAIAAPPTEPEEISDAEAALRMADEHARRGERERAIALYLAASLSALDQRGAIRIARHRTNGEYVRSCSDAAARQPLREIVREVDRTVYGKLMPSDEAVARVASRAVSVVRAAALAALVVLTLGCGALQAGGKDDPAGEQLPMDLLARSGWTVTPLRTSLASLPMPNENEPASVVVVPDIALDEEAEAHLMRWVEAGGSLVLMGSPRHWPKELEAKDDYAHTRDLLVDGVLAGVSKGKIRGARVAHTDALTWPGSEPVAKLGDEVYAAHKFVGNGMILGVANADLFTNIGVARPDNAAALVALFSAASSARIVHVARQEDGIEPPSNPFASLVHAGLGKATLHALAACALLFLAFGIRQSRPRPAQPAARRAFAEHVEATGAFYGRAKAYAHALASYGSFVEMRLRERVPRGGDPAAFLAARAGVDPEHAARVYARATQAKTDDAPRGDELQTLRELRAMVAKAL